MRQIILTALTLIICLPCLPYAQDWTEIEKGVVRIVAANPLDIEKTATTGSGFVVTDDGYIVTNAHVVNVEGEEQIRQVGGNPVLRVIIDKETVLNARKVKVYPEKDLAVIRIDRKGLTFLNLADPEDIKKGARITALGFPAGADISEDAFYKCKVTGGQISALISLDNGLKTIQTDAAISGGNSGGPLCNEDGKVIGVNFIKSTKAEGTSWAIHVDEVKKVLRELNIDLPESGVSFLPVIFIALVSFFVLLMSFIILTRKKIRKSYSQPEKNLAGDIGMNRTDIESKPFRAGLICLKGEYKGSEIPLNQNSLIMGRDPEQANLILSSTGISRKHARITFRPETGDFLLEDMGSHNGTFLKDSSKKISSAVLKPGDVFIMGKQDAVFQAAFR